MYRCLHLKFASFWGLLYMKNKTALEKLLSQAFASSSSFSQGQGREKAQQPSIKIKKTAKIQCREREREREKLYDTLNKKDRDRSQSVSHNAGNHQADLALQSMGGSVAPADSGACPPWEERPLRRPELGRGDGNGLGGAPAAAVGGDHRPALHQLRRAEGRCGAVLQDRGALLQLQDLDHRQPLHQGLREHHQVQGRRSLDGDGQTPACEGRDGSGNCNVLLIMCVLFCSLSLFCWSFLLCWNISKCSMGGLIDEFHV